MLLQATNVFFQCFQADLCQCKYCYKEFDTPYAMQSHLEEVHLKKGSEFVCRLVHILNNPSWILHLTQNVTSILNFRFRICDEGFSVKNHLIHHMSKNHVKSEMPYLCQICGFRSSTHRELIDHFQEVRFCKGIISFTISYHIQYFVFCSSLNM